MTNCSTINRKRNGRPVILYLAGPYKGDVVKHIEDARKIQIDLIEHGYFTINPCNNTANFDLDCDADEEFYMAGDIEAMRRCDILILRPDWWDSSGARREATISSLKNQPGIVYDPTAAFYAKLHEMVNNLEDRS